jgi:cobaltochelatase CobS
VEAAVNDILAGSLATMPDRLRDLIIRANTPRVVEVPVERVVEVPAKGTAAHVKRAPTKLASVKLLRTAKASDVFEIKHPALSRITVAIYNDPDAPAIDPGYSFDPDTLALTLWRMASGASVLLSGPKGTGKTTFAEQIAARLGRYFALLSFDRTTEIDPLIGQIELAEGSTFWRDGALTAALRRPGSIILFDEPDMAKAGSLAALHPVLANRSILIPRTGERVEAAEGVYMLAAANTTGHGDDTGTYVDRNMLDAAFRDRFADIILIPFPDERTERRILVNRTGISLSAAKTLVAFARASRERADKEQDIAAGLGMRRLIAWASGLLSGLRPEVIFRAAIINQHNREEGEVLWQLYKSLISEESLTAQIEQIDPPGTTDSEDGDVL